MARTSHGILGETNLVIEEVVADSRQAKHLTPLILALVVDSWVHLLRGDSVGAFAAAQEAVDVAQGQEADVMEGLATWMLGVTLSEQGHSDEALVTLRHSSDLLRGSELPRWAALALVPLAHAYLDAGDQTKAIDCLDEAARVASAAGYTWILGRIQQVRARLSILNGEIERSEPHIHEALELHQLSGDTVALCDSIDLLGTVWTARGHADAALRLWGAAFQQRANLGCNEAHFVARMRLSSLDDARRAAGDAATGLLEEGRNLDLDQATAYATRNRGKRGRPTSGWASLTPAELGVVELVARHQSNPQIAEQLFISRSTVKSHLIHIFAKLNCSSRSQLAVEAIRRDLE